MSTDTISLIPALRWTARNTLPELTAIPESLTTALFALDEDGAPILSPPYLVIEAQPPTREIETAVRSTANWVPVEFIYVSRSRADGSTDTPQQLRSRLDALRYAFEADYHLTLGQPDVQRVSMTEHTNTQLTRLSAIQAFFAEHDPSVITATITIEFRMVFPAGASGVAPAPPGTGSVTSVGLVMPPPFLVSNSPITTYGDLTVTTQAQPAHSVWAGPVTGSAPPTFRALQPSDIPAIPASGITGLGTAATHDDAEYEHVAQKGVAGGYAALDNQARVPIAQLPTLVGSGNAHQAGLAPDPGLASGTTRFLREDATWAVPPNAPGTVTSVGLQAPVELFGVTGSPVTTSGTLQLNFATKAQNLVFAGPGSGANAAPTFRPLVAADIPALAYASSVGLSMPVEFTVTNSPVTGSDILTVAKAIQSPNLVYCGPPSGGPLAPTFRALVASDIPTLTLSKISDAGTAASHADTDYVMQAGRAGGQQVAGDTAIGGSLLLLGAAASGFGTINYRAGTHVWYSDLTTERMRLTSAGRLGIGTSNPSTPVHFVGTGGGNSFQGEVYDDAGNMPTVNLYKGRGTPAAKAPPQSGDILGRLSFGGYDGANPVAGARLQARLVGAAATNVIPCDLLFYVTDTGLTEKLRLLGTGQLVQWGAAAIPSGSLTSSTFGLWLDATPSAPKLMATSKDSSGTLRTSVVANIPPAGISLVVPSDLSVAGSPALDGGTFTVTRISQAQRLFLASPAGAAGVPSYRAITAADIPALAQYELVANKGIANGYASLDASGLVPTSQLPPTITGTVTSVGVTMPSEFSVTGSPVTTAGTIAVAKANQSANRIYAGPGSGVAAAPTFRALVAADLPAIALSGLSDVALTTLATGEVLTWNAAAGRWKNQGFTLSTLSDVGVAGATNGQSLVYQSATARWIAGFPFLNTLSDTAISAPSNGQALIWQSSTSRWINGTPAAPAMNLDALTDVTIDSGTLVDGQFLAYQAGSSQWRQTTLDLSVYALLAGRSAGQVLSGGTDGTQGLTLRGTSDATATTTVTTQTGTVIWQTGANKAGLAERMRLNNLGYLGVGTNNPTAVLHVAQSAAANIFYEAFGASVRPNLYLQAGRGSVSSPAVLQSGDSLGQIVFRGFDGTNMQQGFAIQVNSTAAPGSGGVASDVVFYTSNGTTNTALLTLRGSNRRIGIFQGSPGAMLDMNIIGTSTPGIKIVGTSGQTADLQQWVTNAAAQPTRINYNGVLLIKLNAAPADADLTAGELAIWLDATPGSTKAMFKAKDSGGTVRSASVALT